MLERLAPAKINLGLHVLRRRPDGYHDIETVLLAFPWTDRVTAEPAESLSMTCSDPELPTDETNLCMQAARRLAASCTEACGATLHLEKRVPYGAGLGSGSSDAAATLQLLNELWSLDATADQLHTHAAAIGSDVPFFLQDGAAYATGRGEVLAPLLEGSGAPYRLPFALVIIVPNVHVPTSDAYQKVQPQNEGRPDLQRVVMSNDLARWRADLVNDFEDPILSAYPEVRAAKERLAQAGAGYTSLSGSGAAVFGVFESEVQARTAADQARAEGYRVFAD